MAPAPVAGGWMTNCPVRPTPPWKFPSSGYWAEVTELGGGGPLAALAVPPLAAAAASTATSAAVAPLPLVLIRMQTAYIASCPMRSMGRATAMTSSALSSSAIGSRYTTLCPQSVLRGYRHRRPLKSARNYSGVHGF